MVVGSSDGVRGPNSLGTEGGGSPGQTPCNYGSCIRDDFFH